MNPAEKPVVRRSPVLLPITPEESERRDGWEVVLEYEGEEGGPWLVDLSHRSRWDLQNNEIDQQRPFGLEVPTNWGEVRVSGSLMINRMNRTQASIWHIGPDPAPATPIDVNITETTDSHCWLAAIGKSTPRVMEALTALDLFPPDASEPFLTQGPVLHVPAQIVTFATGCALFTISRGYGQTFTEAVLHSAQDLGLRPGGERVFSRWRETAIT